MPRLTLTRKYIKKLYLNTFHYNNKHMILLFLFLLTTHASIIQQPVLHHHIDLCFTNVFGFEFYDISQHDDTLTVAQHLHQCIIQQPIYANTDRQQVQQIIEPEVNVIIKYIKHLEGNRTKYQDDTTVFLHQINTFLDRLVKESEAFIKNIQSIERATNKISMQSIAARIDTVPLEEMMLSWDMTVKAIQHNQNHSQLVALLNQTYTYTNDIETSYQNVLKTREELKQKRKEYYNLEQTIKTHLMTYIDSITWV